MSPTSPRLADDRPGPSPAGVLRGIARVIAPGRLAAGLSALTLATSSLALASPVSQAPPAAAAPAQAEAPDIGDTAAEAAPPTESTAPDGNETAPGGSEEETADVPQSDTARVVVDSVSPWVDSDGELMVSGRIVNGTAEPILPETLTLSRSSNRMSIRTDVTDWVSNQPSSILIASSDDESDPPDEDTSGGDADDSPAVEVPDVPASLDPGESTEFEFSVPAEQMRPAGTAVDSWGALGLVVTLTGTTGVGSEDDSGAQGGPDSDIAPDDPAADPAPQADSIHLTAPAFTVWHPDPGVDPTVVTTVLPITLDSVPADGGPLIEPEVLERAADPAATGDYAGALRRSLAAAGTLEDSVLAVDPRLVASARTALELPPEDPEAAEAANAGQDTSGADPTEPSESETGETTPGSTDRAEPDSEDANGEDAEDPADEAPAEEAEDTPDPEAAADRLPHLAEWYSEFTTLAADREAIALPWSDSHVTALQAAASATDVALSRDDGDNGADVEAAEARSSGLEGLMEAAAEERATVTNGLSADARTDVAWPAADTVNASDLDALAAQGTDALILSDAQRPTVTSFTSSAHSTLSTNGDPPSGDPPGVGATDPDDAEGGALRDDEGEDLLHTFVADSGLGLAAAQQASGLPPAPGLTLATSAAITAERPFDSRHLLLTLPRDAAGVDLPELARDLDTAPWLGSASLEALADTEPVARGSLVEPTEDAAGAREQEAADLLDRVGESYGRGSVGAAVFADDAEARRDMARALLACTSTHRMESVRTDSQDAGEDSGEAGDGAAESCGDRTTGWVSSLAEGVRPEPGSSVLLVTGEQAMIPVRVQNSTSRAAQVRLRVESATPQLSAEESEPIELGPEESRSVEVPVRGLANADVRAHVRVLSLDGEPMPQSTDLLVRVRADWENTATIVVGSALAVVLVFGLVKTIRRGRRKIPKNQLDAAVARAQDR